MALGMRNMGGWTCSRSAEHAPDLEWCRANAVSPPYNLASKYPHSASLLSLFVGLHPELPKAHMRVIQFPSLFFLTESQCFPQFFFQAAAFSLKISQETMFPSNFFPSRCFHSINPSQNH